MKKNLKLNIYLLNLIMEITKEIIHNKVNQELSCRIKTLENAIEIQNENLKTASESTAGDKHNTTRAMMHLEEEKIKHQLNQLHKLKSLLNKINPHKKKTKVTIGSLLETNNGYIYIAIPFGNIEIYNLKLIVISIVSPIGKALRNKKINESFLFKNNKWTIKKIS